MPIQKKVDMKFFKKWNKDMAYILGFLFADGNIIKTKRGYSFCKFLFIRQDFVATDEINYEIES